MIYLLLFLVLLGGLVGYALARRGALRAQKELAEVKRSADQRAAEELERLKASLASTDRAQPKEKGHRLH